MRVGLYGGSFDPVHEGHVHVARAALRRLDLDRIIWLVSPQNPLKTGSPSSSWSERLAAAGRRARGPSMVVSDAEGQLGSRFTIDTIRLFKARFPGVHFVWIMGADALAGFHRWRAWREIMAEVPVAVVSRPGETLRSLGSPAARSFAARRLPQAAARRLAWERPPAWVYLAEPLSFASSTALRDRR
jgi:nicotinate-nucleotide adenylyltransferase